MRLSRFILAFPIATYSLFGLFAAERDIHEERYIAIGGIEQWVTIKGERRDNPVILFIHGGPGNPMSGLADSIYRDWEGSLTLVQWDQRGAGRTFAKNQEVVELTKEILDATPLTVELMVSDGIALSEFLIRHLGKEKLILTGSSWGSALGTRMAKQRPDLYHAYIGLSQFVRESDMLAASYRKVKAIATEKNDSDALATIESVGPPPWTDPRSFGRMRRIIRAYEYAVTSEYPTFVNEPMYDTPEARAAYIAGEDFSFLKFVGLNNDGMASTIDLPSLGPVFEIPMHFIQGAKDLLTVPEHASEYFKTIEAPDKSFVLIPESGHDPNIAMIAAQRELIEMRILPSIRESKAPR